MTRRSSRRHPLFLALALSILLHVFAALTLPVPEGRAIVPRQMPIEVALIEQPAPDVPAVETEPQIVTPPDQVNDQPPEETRFQSDHDNVVLRQTVHKGVPNPAPPVPPRQARPEVRDAPATRPREETPEPSSGTVDSRPERGHAPALEDLFASADELVRAQQGDRAREAETRQASKDNDSERRLALALAPTAPEWSLPGTSGTFDYLPDIQRGNVTLLNTKANVFAPFVRRVGERVFQHLIIRQRRLDLEQILGAREWVTMRVLLDPRGQLRSVKLEGQSGSATMDETLADALDSAAFDNNPPRAASNANGNYEFIFQARLRAFQPGLRGRPSRIESRLRVGLL